MDNSNQTKQNQKIYYYNQEIDGSKVIHPSSQIRIIQSEKSLFISSFAQKEREVEQRKEEFH